MKITKFSHSCLLIETKGVKILTDLGSYTEIPTVSDLDVILISHEHGDHFDIEKLKVLLSQNPNMKIITHAAVGAKLAEANILYTEIKHGEKIEIKNVSIESCGIHHAIIYGDTSPCRNSGYFIAGRLFMPGDSFNDVPPKPVEILALPTGGPWAKISESIDYAKKIQPKIAFNIHDAMYTPEYK